MQLIKRQNRKALIPRNVFGEIRDLGVRLEYLVSRYERLVRDLDDATPANVPEVEARVRMANRELSFVAVQLQQLLVEKHETQHSYQPALEAEPLSFEEAGAVPFGMLRDVATA